MDLALGLFIAISVGLGALNCIQYLKYRRLLAQKGQESYEVKDLVADLVSGSMLVEIKRIDPAHVFLRRPV